MATLHIDFVDFDGLLSDVRLELPGVLDATVCDIAAKVLAHFCEETQCYRERITLLPGNTEYELYSPHEDAVVIGLAQLREDQKPLTPGEYTLQATDYLELENPPVSNLTATLILKPLESTSRVPASIFNRWRSSLAKGVKARLMLQSGLPWSNAQLGAAYQSDFNNDLRRIGADVRNDFSVTRKGRTPFKQSNYW